MIKRNIKLVLSPEYGEFNLVTKSHVSECKEWLDSARNNIDVVLAIGREQAILEEDMFLQAAAEIEKDFYYLKDNIDIEEVTDGKNEREYVVLPTSVYWENEDYM
jgi:hypothetical protein